MPRKPSIGSRGLVAVLLVLLAVPPTWSQSSFTVHEQQGTAFVGGGFGAEERDQLRAMRDSFSLELVIARAAGDYLADVYVHIQDEQGRIVGDPKQWSDSHGESVGGKLHGPGNNENTEKARSVKIGGGGMTEVTLTWSAE